MRVADVEWDRANLQHFQDHDRCQQVEVEDILRSRCHPTRAVAIERDQGDEPRRLFYGRTCSDRYLAVVAAPRPHDVMRPITCWPLSARSAKGYEAWRRTVKR